MAGVDKESSEDAAVYLAMIQVDRQVWPVSHLKRMKFSVVNTIVCICTDARAVHLYIYTSLHQFIINLSAWMHPTALIMRTCRVLYQVFHEAFELWYSPMEQFPVHVTLSNEPLPALGALLALIAVCGTQQLPTGELVLWEKLAIPSTDCLLTPCLMYSFSMAFWVTCSARLSVTCNTETDHDRLEWHMKAYLLRDVWGWAVHVLCTPSKETCCYW